MLTEEKKKELLENITSIEEQVNRLNEEKRGYARQLEQGVIENVRDRFSGIAEGDKVKVRYTDWNDKAHEEIFYLKGFHVARYYYVSNIEEYVQVDFYKVKKDGSKSLRAEVINNKHIVNIEKVAE